MFGLKATKRSLQELGVLVLHPMRRQSYPIQETRRSESGSLSAKLRQEIERQSAKNVPILGFEVSNEFRQSRGVQLHDSNCDVSRQSHQIASDPAISVPCCFLDGLPPTPRAIVPFIAVLPVVRSGCRSQMF